MYKRQLIGRVDPNEGVWLQIDPSRTQRIELAKELSDIYGMPCHIDNDVKSATRAERVWGFGQISKNFIYVNVGTGDVYKRQGVTATPASGTYKDIVAAFVQELLVQLLYLPGNLQVVGGTIVSVFT